MVKKNPGLFFARDINVKFRFIFKTRNRYQRLIGEQFRCIRNQIRHRRNSNFLQDRSQMFCVFPPR
jgi:hypothetical protein